MGFLLDPTPYYIFSYGDSWNENAVRRRFLKSLGYCYFFSVSLINSTGIRPSQAVMERFPMDGGALRGKYKHTNVVVNPIETLDIETLDPARK